MSVGHLNMHARRGAATEPGPAVGDLVEYVEDGGVLGKVTAVYGGKVAVEFPNGVATGAPSEFAVVRQAARPTERQG